MNNPIGVFDSGVGGLTVLKEIKRFLPRENIIYLGDNARNPYGSKSEERLKVISMENSQFLLKFGVKMIVVACNTASAVALNFLRAHLNVEVVGVINAGVRAALSVTQNKKIGVIGTRQTIATDVHKNMIQTVDPSVRVFTKATPLFAPVVEEGFIERRSTAVLIEESLEFFKRNGVDTLILGCTHYPLLKDKIRGYLGDVHLVDPAEETAREIEYVLHSLQMLKMNNEQSNRIFVTDRPAHFMEIGKMFLESEIVVVEKVGLEEFSMQGAVDVLFQNKVEYV